MLRGRWALWAVLASLLLPAGAAASGDYLSHCNGNGYCAVVSEDGSRVVFPFQEELTPGAGQAQIYEWNGGEPHPLLPPRPSEVNSFYAGLAGTSADGSHVFIETTTPLAADDLDGVGQDTYDIHEGSATLLSPGGPGTAGGAPPGPPPMWFRGASLDGTHVYFDSQAALVPGDTDGCFDVYERFAGQTSLLSTGPTATSSYPPNLCDMASFRGASADGGRVFFSTGDHLVPEDEGGDDIYERAGGEARPLTTYPEPSSYGENCVDLPWFGDVSADGRTLLFATNTRVTAEDTDVAQDVYKRLPDGSFVLVSRGSDPGAGNGFCGSASADLPVALSADGGVAIFASTARLSPADTDSSYDLYRSAADGTISLVSTGPTDPNVDEQGIAPPQRGTAVSADGQSVAFVSSGALVAADDDPALDVYLRSGDRTRLISTGSEGAGSGAPAYLLGMSADGRSIAFGTGEALTKGDLDHRMDFYLWQEGRAQPLLITAEEIAPRMVIAAHGRLLRDGRLMLRLSCPDDEVSGPCRGGVKLRRGRRGRLVAKASFRIAPGKRRWIRVRPRRADATAHLHRVLVRVRGSDALGNAAVVRRRVVLSAARRR